MKLSKRSGFLALSLCFTHPAQAAETVTLQLQEVRLAELFKVVYGEWLQRNYVLDASLLTARETYAIELRKITPEQAEKQIEEVARAAGFKVSRQDGAVFVSKRKVEPEPPGDQLFFYRPRHRSVSYILDLVAALYPQNAFTSQRRISNSNAQPYPSTPSQSGGQQTSGNANGANSITQQMDSGSSAYSLIDKREQDGFLFKGTPEQVTQLTQLLQQVDTPVPEVVLQAVVYEVGSHGLEGGALKLAASLLQGKLGISIPGTIAGGVSLALKTASLDAVISALDTDERFKVVSRPRVRVRSGASARFAVGSDVPVLGNANLDKNGNPVQSVEYKPSGIILAATPEIREGAIELAVQQEISSFTATTTGVNNSPTLIKRAVNTRLTVQPGELIVLAGLEETKHDKSETRLPLLGWLLNRQAEQRSTEVLIFLQASNATEI